MCSEAVIEAENLGKCYQIYEQPRDRLKQMILPRLQSLAGRTQRTYFREFWALKGVSFKIGRGEAVGIIGRNGSGKSTLLQMICGVLGSTCGRVETRGRIAALLELGSGFNPEFTGRENVYMNATLLGLRRQEIDARYDAIVAFADIGDFIEQPVKTYSSGMFVRLAFSVAVHVQPDILVVDEALSVGDIAFRNKCIEIIRRMMASGVTVLFVTHDLSTLQLLCTRVLWLSDGRLRASGDPVSISQDYYVDMLPDGGQQFAVDRRFLPPQQETGKARFTEVRLLDSVDGHYRMGQTLRFGFTLQAQEELPRIVFAISIYRADGDWLVGQTSRDDGVFWDAPKAGQKCSGSLTFDPLCLAPGEYLVAFAAYAEDYSLCFALTDLCLPFSVRADFPTWGKFHHPGLWTIGGEI